MKKLKLEVGTVYDVEVNTKTGGKRKNKDLNFVQRARFTGDDGEFAKFVVKPTADHPVHWDVLKAKIVKATKAKGVLKEAPF